MAKDPRAIFNIIERAVATQYALPVDPDERANLFGEAMNVLLDPRVYGALLAVADDSGTRGGMAAAVEGAVRALSEGHEPT